MTDKKTNRRIKTPPFRAAFPRLFTPEPRAQNDPTPYYGVEAIFSSDTDLIEMKELAKQVVKEHWNNKPPKKLESPFKKGNEYNEDRDTPRPELEDCIFIRLNTTKKPEVVDKKRQFITDESEIYSGCWMRATVYCHPYDNRGNPQKGNGITFLLNNIQKLKDDEPWGQQRRSAFEDFDDEMSDSTESQEEFADNNESDNIDW